MLLIVVTGIPCRHRAKKQVWIVGCCWLREKTTLDDIGRHGGYGRDHKQTCEGHFRITDTTRLSPCFALKHKQMIRQSFHSQR